jgi:translin
MPEESPLSRIVGQIGRKLEEADRAREQALSLHRCSIRESSLAIRAVHRGEFELARQHLAQAAACVEQVRTTLAPYPDIYYGGFLQDAQKELAEARITYEVVTGGSFPGPEEIGVEDIPYLNGLAEAVGELRRHILDQIRRGQTENSEAILGIMDDIYYSLISMDFPDAITRGLRRHTDVARGCLEKTRGDLTNHQSQRKLEGGMERLFRKMESSGEPA